MATVAIGNGSGGGGGGGGGIVTAIGRGNALAAGTIYGQTYNAMAFGALGNGNSNPASANGFATLTALQAKYSFATALTNEMDWLGWQLAINTAAANGGGTVYGPVAFGTPTAHPVYIMSNANSVADGSGTLTMPVIIPFYPPASGQSIVNLMGDGQDTTVLEWPSDLGTGKFAILDAGRTTTTSGNAGLVQGITLRGPGSISITIGTPPANMSGYGIGSGKHLSDFGAVGFRAGVDFVGGQSKWTRCRFEQNYYNVYWSTPSASLFGDTEFDRCIFQNAALAGIGVNQAAQITECVFTKCTFDTEPWGIFKETNAGSPSQSNTMTFCTFIGTQFEGMGNGAIGDDQCLSSATASSSVSSIFNSHFKDTFFSWDPTHKFSAHGQFGVIQQNDGNLCEFDGISGFSPGTAGVFCFHNGAANGVTVRGAIQDLITAIKAATATAQYLTSAVSEFFTIRLINTEGNYWEGFCGFSVGTITTGEGISIVSSQFGQVSVGGPWGGTTADAPIGVIMQVGGGEGSSNTQCIVANDGFVNMNSSGTFSTTINQPVWLRTGSGGKAIVASSSADTATSPIFGMLAATPSTTTPSTVFVKLRCT
jgi:hypothetical protein